MRATYEISGFSRTSEQIETSVDRALANSLSLDSLPSSACRLQGAKADCRLEAGRRSLANAIGKSLTEKVPREVGWIEAATLDRRIQENRVELSALDRRLKEAEVGLEPLRVTGPADLRALEAEQTNVKRLEELRLQKKRQLDLISEALLSHSSGPNMELFQQKHRHLSEAVDRLDAELSRARASLAAAEGLQAERTRAEAMLSRIRADIELAKAQIGAWRTLRQSAPDAEILPDPEGFRIRVTSPPDIKAHLSWHHLTWSIPLGILLFALYRRRTLQRYRPDLLHSPDEVEGITGLKCLAYLRADGSGSKKSDV